MTTQNDTTVTPVKVPVHKIRVSPVAISIWKNDSVRGEFYSITVDRSYQVDGQWRRTNSYGENHLPALTAALNEARAWIEDHKL